MRLYAASSGSVSSVIGSTAAGRSGERRRSLGHGAGGGGASSGCSPRQPPHLQAQHAVPHHAEEHGEERPLQPVADVEQAARGGLGPSPLPRRQEAARDHRAEGEQMPHDPARRQEQPEHRSRIRRAVTSDHVPAARGLAVAAAARHRPGDHRPGGAQARRHRDPRRADGHARPLRAPQRAVPAQRPAADDAAQRAAGGAQRPRCAGEPRGPGVPADRRAAAGRRGARWRRTCCCAPGSRCATVGLDATGPAATRWAPSAWPR